jgi:hypothetical protein
VSVHRPITFRRMTFQRNPTWYERVTREASCYWTSVTRRGGKSFGLKIRPQWNRTNLCQKITKTLKLI